MTVQLSDISFCYFGLLVYIVLLMFSLFTASGKDGEKISPVMATWCMLVEECSLWFSQMKILPWQDTCYGRTTPVFWKWRLIPRLLVALWCDLPRGPSTLYYFFPISFPDVSRPRKQVSGPGPVRKVCHYWWNSRSISFAGSTRFNLVC